MLNVIIITKKVSSSLRGESEPWGMTMNSPGNDFCGRCMTLFAMRAQNRYFIANSLDSYSCCFMRDIIGKFHLWVREWFHGECRVGRNNFSARVFGA